ncbi:MAG: LON peptidase substrate-binding domain-containing protein, partial [Desulfobacterales bacterium]|nr:LON peptidase substrate-binding domain-containing protein [Desulfobacterales bacterium]
MTQPQSQMELGAEKLPEILPVLPLFDSSLYPKMVLPLVVMQGGSVQLVDEAMSKDRIVGLLASKKPNREAEDPKEDFYSVGTSA